MEEPQIIQERDEPLIEALLRLAKLRGKLRPYLTAEETHRIALQVRRSLLGCSE